MIKSGGNNMCLAILVILALYLMYQLLCKNNKTVGGADENVEDTTNVVENVENNNVIESDTQLESESDLNFNAILFSFTSGKEPLPASTSDSTNEIVSFLIIFAGREDKTFSPFFESDFLEAVIKFIAKLSFDGPSS